MRLARLDRRLIPQLLESPGRVVLLHECAHGGAHRLKVLKDSLVDRLLFPEAQPDENTVLAPPTTTTIRRGDVFQLGRHRLACGDATAATDVARLLAGATPCLMVTDPPTA